jgi:uncharacterized protein (TIGR02145 family)
MNNLCLYLLLLFILHGYKVKGQVYGKGAVDIDGNKYRSVIIGKQEWLERNLVVSRFNNGAQITQIQEKKEWELTLGPSYFIYHQGGENKGGFFYNWNVIYDVRNVCPMGWVVPSDNDWSVLIDKLGGTHFAGQNLKKRSFIFLRFKEVKKIKSNFDAKMAGYITFDGEICDVGVKGVWWSSTENVSNTAWNRFVSKGFKNVYRDDEIKDSGLSIRCIKSKVK